jgi:5-methylthioribose kinase
MLELTAGNALGYLRERCWIGPGSARIEPLRGGVSNVVLRVTTSETTFILKQSRPRLRTQDIWLSDMNRIYREQEVMEVLYPLLPEATVPKVLFSDRDNFVFAMSHAPADARVWKETLLTGQAEATVAERAGQILARIHETTARNTRLVERFADHTAFVQLRVEPFYRRMQERRPGLAGAIEPIIQRMLTRKEALCHGDFSPKNILTHHQGLTLVDYETAHFGDPTMDLGFFVSHLVLKGMKHYPGHQRYLDLIAAFWNTYARSIRYRMLEDLQAESIEHFAVCAAARIDGTSPVDYLPEESKRDAVRQLTQRVLLERPRRWDAVLRTCEALLAKTSVTGN